jgi:TM2 domain-containing membrane protein YozV
MRLRRIDSFRKEGTIMVEPETACGLSFLVPGLGQAYNGDYGRGIAWFLVAVAAWVGTGGLLGWIVNLMAAFTAHRRARRIAWNPTTA